MVSGIVEHRTPGVQQTAIHSCIGVSIHNQAETHRLGNEQWYEGEPSIV